MNGTIRRIFENDPFVNMLNIKLLEWRKGYAKTSLFITKKMLNFHQFAHGGIVFTLADYALAIASNSHGKMAVGINTHIVYANVSNLGEELICTAKEVSRGNKIAIYKMEVTGSSGELKATAEGIVYQKSDPFKLINNCST